MHAESAMPKSKRQAEQTMRPPMHNPPRWHDSGQRDLLYEQVDEHSER